MTNPNGRFGIHGGQYIPETLMNAVIELEAAVMLFILPAPFVLPAFSKEAGEAGYLSSTLSIMTVITIVGFVVMAVLAG